MIKKPITFISFIYQQHPEGFKSIKDEEKKKCQKKKK